MRVRRQVRAAPAPLASDSQIGPERTEPSWSLELAPARSLLPVAVSLLKLLSLAWPSPQRPQEGDEQRPRALGVGPVGAVGTVEPHPGPNPNPVTSQFCGLEQVI